jgi:hypothetical protein
MNYWSECLKTTLGMPISPRMKGRASNGKTDFSGSDFSGTGGFNRSVTENRPEGATGPALSD